MNSEGLSKIQDEFCNTIDKNEAAKLLDGQLRFNTGVYAQLLYILQINNAFLQ